MYFSNICYLTKIILDFKIINGFHISRHNLGSFPLPVTLANITMVLCTLQKQVLLILASSFDDVDKMKASPIMWPARVTSSKQTQHSQICLLQCEHFLHRQGTCFMEVLS